ncbi:MAG: pilus assembly protein [Gemmatales bacterium]|nr:pilus assembly protein [Gemmatales bacterium]MDW7993753.1 pilus assembly protein [Gemmatales bacterium]
MTADVLPYAFNKRRRGASIVEAAIVLALALLFLFGILEYCRFFFVRNTLIAAAREGARFAVVHTHDRTTEEVRNHIYQYLRPLGANLHQFNPSADIILYKADSAGNPVRDGHGNLVPWTDASYGESIGVRITARYKPTVPILLGMPQTLTIRARCCMSSEAN